MGFDDSEVYTDVWGLGNYAYLGSQTSGFAIIDVSNSQQPNLASVFGANFNTGFTDTRQRFRYRRNSRQ